MTLCTNKGDGHVVNDKRFLGPALDVTTDTGNIRSPIAFKLDKITWIGIGIGIGIGTEDKC